MGGTKLLFEADGEVAEAVGESGTGVGVVEIVGDAETEFSLVCDSQADAGLGEIACTLACVAGGLESILKLEASAGD
jgi:hypothetical protein